MHTCSLFAFLLYVCANNSALPAGEPSDVLEVSDASDSPVDADVVNDVSSEASRRLFSFRQPVPVPSYLIAVAVGQLESREISHRCRVSASC
jgi:hypothetical protein